MLQLAIEEQTLIGWHQLLLGYISKKWLLLATMDTPHIGTMTLSAGQSRTHKALKALTLMVRELWLGRNKVLHIYTDKANQTIYSLESAAIRHFHSTPNLIPTSDQHYCQNITLNKLLRSRPSVRRCWLNQVKAARAAYLKDGQNQQMLTRYMERIPLTRADKTNRATRATATHTTESTQHNYTATDDNIFSRTPSRHNQINPQKSFALFTLERCQGWVPCESLEKFLLEANLYNLFYIFLRIINIYIVFL
jgi:hypothetical protein